MQDTRFAETWVAFANVSYLLNHGCFDAEKLAAARVEMATFAERYKRTFLASGCSWKFHIFQHFIHLAERHGPAFLWDAFNFERSLGMMKRDVTATRGVPDHAARNFIVRHQSLPMLRVEDFDEKCNDFLSELGALPCELFVTKLKTCPLAFARRGSAMPREFVERFEMCAMEEMGMTAREFRECEKRRVTRIRRLVNPRRKLSF